MAYNSIPVMVGNLLPENEYNEGPKDECGITAVYDPNGEAATLAYSSLKKLQHRGHDGAGVAFLETESSGRSVTVIRNVGRIASAIDTDNLRNSELAIGHTRYGTSTATMVGEEHTSEQKHALEREGLQPFTLFDHTGLQVGTIAHNGQFVEEDVKRLAAEYGSSTEGTDSKIVAGIISESLARNFGHMDSTLAEVLPRLSGSFSLTILTKDAVYGVKDRHGIRPLWVGVDTNTERTVIASEISALKAGGAEPITEVEPGTFVKVDSQGMAAYRWAEGKSEPCILGHAYFLRPSADGEEDSIHAGLSARDFRLRMGANLAGTRTPKEWENLIDMVVPVVGSGRFFAQGFSEVSGVPYKEALIKNPDRPNPDSDRTFITAKQSSREEEVRAKLIAVREILEGKHVAAFDDTNIRGTTAKAVIKMLREAGAASVTWIAGMPPIRHPCNLGMAFGTYNELLAHGRTLKEMQREIGADNLIYSSVEHVKRAAGPIGQAACKGCMTGHYPDVSASLDTSDNKVAVA